MFKLKFVLKNQTNFRRPKYQKNWSNIKFDYIILKKNKINISPIEDTMLASYTLDAGINKS